MVGYGPDGAIAREKILIKAAEVTRVILISMRCHARATSYHRFYVDYARLSAMLARLFMAVYVHF